MCKSNGKPRGCIMDATAQHSHSHYPWGFWGGGGSSIGGILFSSCCSDGFFASRFPLPPSQPKLSLHLCSLVNVSILFKNFLVLLSYNCPHFPPITLPCPTHPPPPTFNSPTTPTLLSFSMGSLYMFLHLTFPLLSPIIPLPSLLWSLSVCSLFPCLCFYFAFLFVLNLSIPVPR